MSPAGDIFPASQTFSERGQVKSYRCTFSGPRHIFQEANVSRNSTRTRRQRQTDTRVRRKTGEYRIVSLELIEGVNF